MISRYSFRACLLALATSIVLLTTASAFGAATIVIQNGDAAGVGFNDGTPVAPVGGNPGTTVGQQRLNAFQAAANIWGATLNSGPTITVLSTWEALSCTSNSAILGSASAIQIFRDFPGSTFPATWFGGALANRLGGTDFDGTPEIRARFNVNLGNPGCLDGTHYYLGLDNNHGNDIDLVAVLLHEFAHGLGFQTFTSGSSGAQTLGSPTVYDMFLTDDTSGKTWVQMTNAERQASAVNTLKLSWNGSQVTGAVPSVLTGTPVLRVNSPGSIAGTYAVGTASFGAALSSPGITGNVVQALDPADGAGPSTTDGCSALTNAGAVSGNIALIDRGTCAFVIKVKNAQNAGAIGVVIVDNVPGSPPPGLGGSDASITIPSVRVTQADGTTIRNQLGSGVNASLTLDLTRRSGTNSFGRALIYAPNPFESGSSVSHWDTSAFPNLLMEPNISGDLSHSVVSPQDLTYSLLRDVGWSTAADTGIQLSASNYNTGEGDGSIIVTVNRTGDTSGVSAIDFASSNGTASQLRDYEVANGTLTFAAGQTSRTFRVLVVDDVFAEANETVNLTLSNPTGGILTAPTTATVTILDNDSGGSTSPTARQFVSNLTGADEVPATPNAVKDNGGIVQLSTDALSAKVSLLFSGLTGSETGAHVHAGAPGVNGPIIFPLPLGSPINNFVINPSAQQVADLRAGQQYMNVHSSGFLNGEIRGQLQWNPAEEADFFVRQAYFDFLSRVPDTSGFNFWVGEITNVCQSDVECLRRKRVDVSNAFFYEQEFQQTAAYVLRLYRGAYGNNQPFPNPNPNAGFPNEEKKLPSYAVFVADRARVIGGANLAQKQLDLANLFVTRPEFLVKYPTSLATADQFVDALLLTLQNDLGVNLSGQRANLINIYNTQGGRGAVLYRLSDDNAAGPVANQPFIDEEYNRSFVLGQYFGYLRRNPDIPGFVFWLGQVNGAPLRNVAKQHAMVCSFITAAEFQLRFGPVASRNNNECPQ